MKSVIRTWKETLELFKKQPKLLAPFLIMAALSGALLYVLYLAPQRPVALLLAPPIARFRGARFLHYPYNLSLLPELFYYAHLLLSASAGVLMTGLAIGMIKEAHAGKSPKILVNLINALRRALPLLGIWLIMFGCAYLSEKLLKEFTKE